MENNSLQKIIENIGMIHVFNKDYIYETTYLHYSEAKLFGRSEKEVIAAVLNHELTADGHYYIQSPCKDLNELQPDKVQKYILQINKLGLVEFIYDSQSSAISDYSSSVSRGIKMSSPSCGYYWRKIFSKASFKPVNKINRFIKHNVNDEIMFYKDLKSASEDTLLSEQEIYDSIFTATECYNKNNEWSYIRTTYDFEELTNKDIKDIEAENTMLCFKPQPNDFCMVNVKKSTREILMISKDGNIVNTFTSINQAQLKTGIYNIWPCVNHIGKHKTAGGYYWKFKDEYEDTI